MRRRILVTGFEPFLNHSINPTAHIVQMLNGEEVNQYRIIGKVLSVDFKKTGKQMVDLLESVQPDCVVSLGLAAGRNQITPERVAINCNDGPEDNQGYKPSGEKIIEHAPDGYFSTLPLYDIVEQLHLAELPVKISNSAGTYLCNHVMYQTLHFIHENHFDCKAGFIHLPASHELVLDKNIPSWSETDLTKAVRIILTCLATGVE